MISGECRKRPEALLKFFSNSGRNFLINDGDTNMSKDEMIHDIITRARVALQDAQEKADDTPRPVNACPAHDSQFALTKAISGALDTILLMAQQNIAQPQEAPQGKLAVWAVIACKPWPWIAFSIAAFSPNFPMIMSAIQGVSK
jgi:hypothetical protein